MLTKKANSSWKNKTKSMPLSSLKVTQFEKKRGVNLYVDYVSENPIPFMSDTKYPATIECIYDIELPKKKDSEPKKPKFKTKSFLFGPFVTGKPRSKGGYGEIDKKEKVQGAWTITQVTAFYRSIAQECKDYYTYSKNEKRPLTPRNLIKGFADSRGTEAKNHGLSKVRAQAVQQLLLDQFGGDPSWFPIKAAGERVPNRDGKEGKNAAKNRVLEVTIQYF